MALTLVFMLAAALGANAAPSMRRISLTARALHPRQSQPASPTSGLSVQVWAPLVAITVVIIAMISFSCVKRRRAGAVSVTAARANASTRELTADQLTGSAGTAAAGTAAARRNRRQRRTPSQISTRSLPAYMEDPGDSEMVLARGTQDMEDPMPTLAEDQPEHNTSNSLGSIGDFNVSTTSQTPLLRTESHLTPPHDGDIRASLDTVRMGSEDSQHGLLDPSHRHSRQLSAEEIQARGDAPPYFEAVDHADIADSSMEMTEMRTPTASSPAGGAQLPLASPEYDHESTPTQSTLNSTLPISHSRRRSGFRSFAARLSQLMPSTSSSVSASTAPAPPPVPTLAPPGSESEQPPNPSASPTPRTHTRHRSTTSGSGSTLASTSRLSHILPHTRSMRSLRSTPSSTHLPLTSPSTTSLGPISAPLPHTLVRTEFVYPQSGPTTEQMKFISSRETVGKFGVPYGLAAQVASREALALASDEAPPPFESPMVEAGPSAVRGDGDGEGDGDGRSSLDSSGPTQSDPDADADPAPAPPSPKRADTQSSQSSVHESIATFETAPESAEDASEHEHEPTVSRSLTPTPAPPALDLDLDAATAATKSVPTPPPTPPRAQGPTLSTLSIPRITVAPASPA